MELAFTLVALALFVLVFALGQDRRARSLVFISALAVVGVAGALIVGTGLGARIGSPSLARPGPVQVLRDGYTSSDRCRACHPAQYESWHRSFHRTMTQPGTLDAIEAPFEGEVVDLWGQSYRFFTREGQPWAELPDPLAPQSRQQRDAFMIAQGPRVERPVTLVTGSHHYQVYWVPQSDDPETRALTSIPVVWRIAEREWIPRSAAFLMPPTISNRELPWGLVCIKCHATGGRPGLELKTDYVELGIACEACHGPAEAHIEHYQNPARRYLAHLDRGSQGGRQDGTIVDPAKLPGSRGSEICAQCHSLLVIPDSDGFIEHGTPFRPGDAIADHFPEIRGEGQREGKRMGTFWSDGEIRLTGREWVSMSASACFEEGELSCMDCHSMHEGSREDQLHPVAGGDAGCGACHDASRFADEDHTHHGADSTGSSCLNCHMPRTSYGLLGSVRTHRITSPRAQVSLDTGRPTACNLCHLDRSLAWTAEQLAGWYGQERVTVEGLPARVAEGVRLALMGDAGQRALAVDAMGWGPAQEASGTVWMAPFLGLSLNDPYDAVRQIAYRSLRTLPDYEDFGFEPLAPPEQRVSTAGELIPAWFERHKGEIDGMAEAVPLDPIFGFDRGVIQALLSNRNNQPVSLTE